MTGYYLVLIDLTYSNQTTTLQELESRGCSVSESRRFGDLNVYHDDRMVGWLFSSQADQVDFLLSRGAF